MYLGAAGGMLLLPIESREIQGTSGPQMVFVVESALGLVWSFLWFMFASDPVRSEHPKAASCCRFRRGQPTNFKRKEDPQFNSTLEEDNIQFTSLGDCDQQLHFSLCILRAHELVADVLLNLASSSVIRTWDLLR